MTKTTATSSKLARSPLAIVEIFIGICQKIRDAIALAPTKNSSSHEEKDGESQGIAANPVNSRKTEPVLSIAVAEAKAMDILESELAEPLTLATRLYNLIGRILQRAVNADAQLQSKKVSMALLSRIANDLRCCIHLSVRGYGAQACSIAASIYEESFATLAIGANEPLAQQWIDHSDPTNSFKRVKELTDLGLIALGVKTQEAGRQYLKFRNLCLAKHSNPLFVKQRASGGSSQGAILKSGPDTSELGIRDGWFALEHATGFSFLATAGFLKHHVAAENELFTELGEIANALISLNRRAVARWGSEDPFPGKWKL